MTSAHFRFSTDIIRRLGEELNPSPERSILELVKNAFDADATSCKVELVDTDDVGGTVRVTDNGDGMSVDDIKNSWLVLGKSTKDSRTTTRKGRRPVGNKGLGRLAALRLGDRASIKTQPRGSNQRHDLLIKWQDFDKAQLVENVPLTIQSKRAPARVKTGTVVSISGLHKTLGRMDVKRLARELLLLADPFQDSDTTFNPELVAPEFRDLEKLVAASYFNQADYHLAATVDAQGQAEASVLDWKGETLFTAVHEDITHKRRKGGEYKCPPCTFEVWVFLLKKEVFSTRPVSIQEVQEWLAQFGGIHFYENGLRVAPYGNPGNDWLDMNLQRSRSPEERPSTNTAIGRVVVPDSGEQLAQKTDRSGFIESDAFHELREFAQNALDWMAKRRLKEAEKRRRKEREVAARRATSSKQRVEDAIGELPTRSQPAVLEAFSAYERSRAKEVAALQKEVQLYRTLSTAGITAATFAHESTSNPLKVISLATNSIERRGKDALKRRYPKLLEKPVGSIRRATGSLGVLSAATLRLVDHDKRRWGKIDLHSSLGAVAETFDPFLSGRDIKVHLELDDSRPYLRGSEAAIESILTNIVNNSVAAFERHDVKKRQIWIGTAVESDTFTLRVWDNGPGIEDIPVADIWLPGETTRPNGTGLGLTIVRDAVHDLGGSVDAQANGPEGGAEIIITLPIIGA